MSKKYAVDLIYKAEKTITVEAESTEDAKKSVKMKKPMLNYAIIAQIK